RERRSDGRIGGVGAGPGGRLLGAVAGEPRQGEDDYVEVERDLAVGDVLHVVSQLIGPRLLAGDPRLRQPGHPGTDDEALPVLRDLTAELGKEGGADRPWTDDRHVAAQHVPEMRDLVEVGLPQDAADPGPLFL